MATMGCFVLRLLALCGCERSGGFSCARAGSCWREANLGNDDPGRYRLPAGTTISSSPERRGAYGGEFGRR